MDATKIEESREIYINASKVSHFTQFNRFTKEDEDIEILYEHNLWLQKYFRPVSQDPIAEIVHKLGDAEISSLAEDLGVSVPPESKDTPKKSIIRKIEAKVKEAVEADYDKSKITIQIVGKGLEKLENKIEEIVRVERGTLNESKDIKSLGIEVKIDTSFKKKELFRFDSKNVTYKVIIGGRIDGYVDESTILETKHRRNRLFGFIPKYEMVQIEMYLHILNLKKCLHVENYNGLQNKTEYAQNDTFLNEIKDQMKQYFDKFLEKYKI